MKQAAHTIISAAAGVALLPREAAFACAVCGLDSEPGFLWSMGFLIAMPFAIGAAGCFVYNARRGRERAGERGIFSERKERAQ